MIALADGTEIPETDEEAIQMLKESRFADARDRYDPDDTRTHRRARRAGVYPTAEKAVVSVYRAHRRMACSIRDSFEQCVRSYGGFEE